MTPAEPSARPAASDVIVIGLGAAGVAAAIAAAESGASVLVLEKQTPDQHTPSASFAGSMIMLSADEDLATTYLLWCAAGATGEAECRAWAQGAATIESWLMQRCPGIEAVNPGGHYEGAVYADSPGARGVFTRDFRFPGERAGSGELLHGRLVEVMKATGRVRILWNTPARRLLKDGVGAVIGVEVAGSGEQSRLYSRGGVVLATGGFENDERAKRNFLRASPMYFAGNPGNTGDGLRMAQDAGADLWHMNVAIGRQATHVQGEDGRWFNYQMNLTHGAFVVLDRLGRRYCDEGSYVQVQTTWAEMQVWETQTRSFTRIPSTWVFDSRRFALRLAAGSEPATSSRPHWTDNNHAELARGWVLSAPTVMELAHELGVPDPPLMVQSIDEYNAGVRAGRDRFGRDTSAAATLDRPPFFAVRLYPGGVNTAGGPRHDARGRVLDAAGRPIAGLFAAGTVSQLIGHLYPSPGAGWSEALATGRIAGLSAAELCGQRAAPGSSRRPPTDRGSKREGNGAIRCH